MIAAQEVTKWKDGNDCNHIYILSDDRTKLYAYLSKGKTEWHRYQKSLRFNPYKRVFKVLKSI